jgi:predicted RNase H-like HicB family nuclease
MRALGEETMMEYSIVIHEAEEGGYWAEAPALEGCYAQGESIEETLEEMKGAIESHIEFLLEDGREIPQDMGLQVARVTVSVPSAA